jgi:hypothetical protein
MDNFLKQMIGSGLLSSFDTELEALVRHMDPMTSNATTSASNTIPTNTIVSKTSDAVLTSTEVTSQSSTASRMPGRSPHMTGLKELPKMSTILAALVKRFKDETRKFGAPANKFRMNSAHIDMCLK